MQDTSEYQLITSLFDECTQTVLCHTVIKTQTIVRIYRKVTVRIEFIGWSGPIVLVILRSNVDKEVFDFK